MKEKRQLTDTERAEITALMVEAGNISRTAKSEQARKAGTDAVELAHIVLNGGSLKRYNLKITVHTGKLENMRSISTYKKVCDTCRAFSKINGSICSRCYAEKYILMRDNLRAALIYNTLLLKYRPLERVPLVNDIYFRFEAFSDLQNITHLKNLYLICKKNRNTNFALWTKNATFLKEAGKTPRNLKIIYSSLFINECAPRDLVAEISAKIAAPVKVFTVYDKEHAKQEKINCGGARCLSCLKCYKNYHVNEIKEILK